MDFLFLSYLAPNRKISFFYILHPLLSLTTTHSHPLPPSSQSCMSGLTLSFSHRSIIGGQVLENPRVYSVWGRRFALRYCDGMNARMYCCCDYGRVLRACVCVSFSGRELSKVGVWSRCLPVCYERSVPKQFLRVRDYWRRRFINLIN